MNAGTWTRHHESVKEEIELFERMVAKGRIPSDPIRAKRLQHDLNHTLKMATNRRSRRLQTQVTN